MNAVEIALLGSGLFFICGLLTGLWKYRCISSSPDAQARWNVLLMHGEVEGMPRAGGMPAERAAVEVSREELGASSWSYVALGHYHVYQQIAPNAFYAGSIDYTSTNPWEELVEERSSGLPGKGFIEHDLETGEHRFDPAPMVGGHRRERATLTGSPRGDAPRNETRSGRPRRSPW